MTTTIPTPSTLFGKRKAPVVPRPPKIETPQIAAPLDLSEPGVIVRPGMVETLDENVTHDGVVKAKHLKPGQRVRPFVNGKARGGERIVGSTERVQGGAYVKITWASPHSPSEHKAAYRWFDQSLVGTPVVVLKPGFVSYEEV